MASIVVKRLNHAVLFVSDLERAVRFYREAFAFEEVAREGPMAFLRASAGENHHDLGLLGIGAQAPHPAPGSTGLYHLAWEVASIEDLAQAEDVLRGLGALSGRSDHGATKSLYGADPDGNEFEVMWMLPREQWGEYEGRAIVAPLDLEGEVARFGATAS